MAPNWRYTNPHVAVLYIYIYIYYAEVNNTLNLASSSSFGSSKEAYFWYIASSSFSSSSSSSFSNMSYVFISGCMFGLSTFLSGLVPRWQLLSIFVFSLFKIDTAVVCEFFSASLLSFFFFY
jgi:hypothetical protein